MEEPVRARLLPFFRVDLSADELLAMRRELQQLRRFVSGEVSSESLVLFWFGGRLEELLGQIEREAEG